MELFLNGPLWETALEPWRGGSFAGANVSASGFPGGLNVKSKEN